MDDIPSFGLSLMCGALAGMAVDVSLFPLDTIKTRLQSAKGFWSSGGFHKIYSGLGSVLVGSAPSAAVFFCTYDSVKSLSQSTSLPYHYQSFIHMGAASCGEAASCLVRVPTEVVKQRAQANSKMHSLQILKDTVKNEGIFGMYRGYFSTLFREIPFSFIQFPIWEFLKHKWSLQQRRSVSPWQSSLCGAVSGSIAACITTPLDVAKTRIMLAERGSRDAQGHIFQVLNSIYKNQGLNGLFSGLVPRVLWISMGGAIFFGVYEKSRVVLRSKSQ